MPFITGEGTTDVDTFRGKGPGALAVRAQKAGVPVIIVSGQITASDAELKANGVVDAQSLMSYTKTEDEAKAKARVLITRATKDVLERRRVALKA